jgi:hypothetical protein
LQHPSGAAEPGKGMPEIAFCAKAVPMFRIEKAL